jgi:2,3-bisphosphoglycerate-independent phosphoglycerate mutase
MNTTPLVLLILDGWGHRLDPSHNPTQTVPTPTLDYLVEHYPHCLLSAAGPAVGLPKGQMGNSEVGHLHIGSGRKCPQDLVRINLEIDNHSFEKNPVFLDAIATAKEHNSAVHVIGLLSPGGVHSHQSHLFALIQMLSDAGITKNYCHALLDGRDTPPQSAMSSITQLEALYDTLQGGQIASISGRYYGMDRDKRWERTQKMFDLLTLGVSDYTANSAQEALEHAYARMENDEFVSPTHILKNSKTIVVNDNDVIVFMNFRADRARQLTDCFVDKNFPYFKREKLPRISRFITLTQYREYDCDEVKVAYAPLSMKNTLGECIANAGLSQLRLAETEKYAHVTYFLNGGKEDAFPNEHRTMIPSPKVATYDLQPEMSAYALTDMLVGAIESKQYDFIVCNYANPDMVGHTGHEQAAQIAVSVIDTCLKKIVDAIHAVHGQLCITADHGNIEMMYDEAHGQPHTAHTLNDVPFIYVGEKKLVALDHGALDDVAPTILYLLGIETPPEMTGKILLSER